MSELSDAADAFRSALLQADSDVARTLVAYYAGIVQRLQATLDPLLAEIAAAQADGPASVATLFRAERLQTLQRQAEAELAQFARLADGQITHGQQETVALAQQHAEAMVRAALGPPPAGVALSWARLPQEAVAELVGVLGNGSPLRTLLDDLGPSASQHIRQALVRGVAVGTNPQTIAAEIKQDLGGNLVRALTVSRTEMLRASREASRQSYLRNDDVVRGWRWRAALGRRSCPACLAMSGTFHTLDERLNGHVRCRCVAIPETKSWAELGFDGVPEREQEFETGADWFERQDRATQEAILGKAKLAALDAGEIELRDLVRVTESKQWGSTRSEASLAEARQAAANRPPPPKGKAAGSELSPAEQTARRIEAEIHTLRKHEELYAIADDGTVKWSAKGGKSSVSVPPVALRQFTDTVVTHNHPDGWRYSPNDPQHAGNSFSAADIRTAAEGHAREIRAVTPLWRFRLLRPAQGWHADYYRNVLQPAYHRHHLAVRELNRIKVMQGTMTIPEANASHFHEVWTRVAAQLGLDYRREALP